MSSTVLAAWVQAFGVIAALAGAVWHARLQARMDRRQQRQASLVQRRERLKAANQLVTAVKRIAVRARSLGQVVPDPADAGDTIELFVTELQVVADAIRRFDVTLFTSQAPIEAMLVSGSLAKLLADRLGDARELAGSDGVRRNAGILDLAIAELDERTARLTRLLANPRDI